MRCGLRVWGIRREPGLSERVGRERERERERESRERMEREGGGGYFFSSA